MTDAPQPELSEEQLAELERRLKWTLTLARIALEDCRIKRVLAKHNDITFTKKDGVQWVGLYQEEYDDVEGADDAIPALLAMARRSVPGDVDIEKMRVAMRDCWQRGCSKSCKYEGGWMQRCPCREVAETCARALLSAPQGPPSSNSAFAQANVE